MTIAALDNLRGRQLAVVVTVAGLTDRYFCGPAPDVSAVPGTGGALTYRDVNALLDMGAESSSIEEVECTVTQTPVVVRLAARDAPISAATVTGSTYSADPVRTLRRIGPAGATLRTTIAGTVPHELGPTDIDTTDDVSAWPAGLYHIGLESVYAVATVGAQLQTCTRGAAHTRIARHLYQPTRGYQPSITSEPTFWRGRRATVEAAPVVDGARVGSYVEIWRGVLDREPELSSDGMTLTLRIAPLSALMRQRFAGGAVSTTLVRGWHYFTPRVGAEIRLDQIWERGAAVEAAYDENGGHAETTQAARFAHERIFDVSLPMGHPRAGDVELYNNTLRIVHRVTGYIGNDRLDVDPVAIPIIVGSVGDLTTPYIEEACTLSLVDPAGAPEIVRWPDRALAVISGALPAAVAWNTTWNACDRWRVVTNQGQLGRWASVELSQDGAGWLWRAGLVEPGMSGSTLALRWVPSSSRVCVGVDYRAPDDARPFIDIEAQSVGIRREAISNATAEARARLSCRGPALAWFHSVEPALLVVDDVFAGGSPQVMRISGGEVNYSTGAFDVTVSASTPALDPDTGALIGYLLTVDSAQGDGDLYALDHGTPVTVTPRARSLGVAPSTLLLRLLESGAGTGTNGVYDVLAYGANLDASDIAENAFLSFAVPDALQGSDFDIDPTKSVDETLRDVLTLLGGAVVQRWVDGRQRLTLTSLAPAHDAESVMAITDADLLTDEQCASSIDGRVVRAYRLESDHDAAGVAQRITTYVDSDAVTAAGGDAGEQLALDLRGIRFDGDPADVAVAILPIVQHLRRRAGAPRVRYQVAVSVDHPGALEVGLGDVVTLTCASAIGIDGSIGISVQACRVLGVERDWLQGRVALTLASAGMRAAGWSPSLRVRDVLSPLVVRVEDSVYTDTTEPRTGEAQNDIERTSLKYFAIGDSVRCVPAGDYAAAVQRTIVDRVIGVLEFDAPHGLQPGDDIDHASWGAASTAARAYAYLDRGLRIG